MFPFFYLGRDRSLERNLGSNLAFEASRVIVHTCAHFNLFLHVWIHVFFELLATRPPFSIHRIATIFVQSAT